ncbi:S1 family peptidase [Saccharopolyspora sp. TS4A08]|uniref:S1 family peptidase n=1 Tax=Saccharopolyspora ipomoeae TaxID=3042027 RepID=A0ABT6PRQ3_9PSEU|nr:S1 family peptidase [Saccharopolyspora sp. TS4A08]MDI2030689.1 S1 family peptidase [Saccharopolyspora sp. TS4A08]
MKRRLAARIAGTVLVTAGTVAALTVPATATAPTSVPVAGTLLEAMQRDLGLTEAQALDRLHLESAAQRTESTLRGALADAFGGAYFDSATGKLVVGVTDAARSEQVRAAGAEVRQVAFSAQQLTGVVDGLNAGKAQAPQSVTGWYTSNRQNAVVVTVKPGAAAEAAQFAQAAGAPDGAVKIVESQEQPKTLMDVVGGNAYYIGSGARCSVGFAVDGGFVSAGHCGGAGDTTTEPSGTFEGSSFPGDDYSYISVGDDDTPQPAVNNYQGGTQAVAGSSEAAEGASICRSGSTTGWHCGTVEAKNQSVQYEQGTVEGLTRTDVCAEPGDSGGSFISGDQAQGMTSGGSGDCSSGGTTYFQPVGEALSAYGVSLLTQ